MNKLIWFTNHVLTTYQPHTDCLYDHILTTYQPHTDHTPTTYQRHTDCLYPPHTDQMNLFAIAKNWFFGQEIEYSWSSPWEQHYHKWPNIPVMPPLWNPVYFVLSLKHLVLFDQTCCLIQLNFWKVTTFASWFWQAILKADKVAAVLHHFLPNGQVRGILEKTWHNVIIIWCHVVSEIIVFLILIYKFLMGCWHDIRVALTI